MDDGLVDILGTSDGATDTLGCSLGMLDGIEDGWLEGWAEILGCAEGAGKGGTYIKSLTLSGLVHLLRE